jgi:hypothetical protein
MKTHANAGSMDVSPDTYKANIHSLSLLTVLLGMQAIALPAMREPLKQRTSRRHLRESRNHY